MKKFAGRLLSFLAVGAMTASFALTSGCGETESSEYIIVIGKSEDQFWEMVNSGAADAAEELEVKWDYYAPETEDADAQIKLIQQAVQTHADVVVLAPVDNSEALNEAVKTATESGVAFITIDSSLSYDKVVCSIKTNNISGGSIAARNTETILIGNNVTKPVDEQIAIISHSMSSQSAQDRTQGFVDQIASDSTDERKFDITRIEDCGGDINLSKEVTKKILKENSDVHMIYATNQPGTIGACQAIAEEGAGSRVSLIGFDFFEKTGSYDGALTYIENGVLDGVIAQNPYNMGYLGMRFAVKYATGSNIPSSVDTGAYLVNKDNIENKDIKLLLYPTK